MCKVKSEANLQTDHLCDIDDCNCHEVEETTKDFYRFEIGDQQFEKKIEKTPELTRTSESKGLNLNQRLRRICKSVELSDKFAVAVMLTGFAAGFYLGLHVPNHISTSRKISNASN